MLEREINEKSIIVKTIRSSTDEVTGQFRLDKGEAEAYVLYNELHDARVILTDDGEPNQVVQTLLLFRSSMLWQSLYGCLIADYSPETRPAEYLRKLNDYGRYSGKVYNVSKEEAKCP